ncbi:PH domain-containing protein [candidate division WWE3 bacterium]|uniref:PH domain-containing protein n=1 Tax=candidate division WWE3 bacterium TaxID=2053526 RepID=A0A3A4ZC67_UNCKA|nr:MAG: PH domain-containing protein [candidate division WWE3 bacterium]
MYDGEDNDEKILYVIRRSRITNLSWILLAVIMFFVPFLANPFLRSFKVAGVSLVSIKFVIIFTLSWYLATIGLAFFNFLNWYFNVYVITNKKIIDFDFFGITYKNITETTLYNVEDVTSTISGPFHTIFNIGDVFIQTAGEKREFDFVLVDNPGKVRDIISDLVAEKRDHHGNN